MAKTRPGTPTSKISQAHLCHLPRPCLPGPRGSSGGTSTWRGEAAPHLLTSTPSTLPGRARASMGGGWEGRQCLDRPKGEEGGCRGEGGVPSVQRVLTCTPLGIQVRLSLYWACMGTGCGGEHDGALHRWAPAHSCACQERLTPLQTQPCTAAQLHPQPDSGAQPATALVHGCHPHGSLHGGARCMPVRFNHAVVAP